MEGGTECSLCRPKETAPSGPAQIRAESPPVQTQGGWKQNAVSCIGFPLRSMPPPSRRAHVQRREIRIGRQNTGGEYSSAKRTSCSRLFLPNAPAALSDAVRSDAICSTPPEKSYCQHVDILGSPHSHQWEFVFGCAGSVSAVRPVHTSSSRVAVSDWGV